MTGPKDTELFLLNNYMLSRSLYLIRILPLGYVMKTTDLSCTLTCQPFSPSLSSASVDWSFCDRAVLIPLPEIVICWRRSRMT